MSLQELLKKIGAGEELTDEERSEIANYKEPDNSDAFAKIKKTEREKASKRETELNGELEELRERLEDMESSDNKADTLAKKMERQEKKMLDIKNKLEAEMSAHQGTKRDNRIEGLLNNHTWVDGEARGVAKSALQEKLKEVDDLSDSMEVDPILSGFVESDFGQRLIMARSSGGSGSEGSNGNHQPTGNGFTMSQIEGMSTEEFLKNEDAIMAAEQAGQIKP